MADKIPIYGELDCRTSENIIADAEQIRYDATKNVKAKIEELETSGVGGVDEETFDSTTAGILQQICAIADTPIDEMTKILLFSNDGDVLYVNKINPYEDGYLSLGVANSDQTFTPLNSSDYYMTNYNEALNIRLPCVIRSYKLRDGNCGWEIQQVQYSAVRRFIKSIYIAAKNSNVIWLPVAIGAYSNDKGGHWTTSLGGKVVYKVIRPSSKLIMPKFSIQNISSSNAQVIDQYTVCEKYDSIYYRATHYFKLKATSTSGKIHLEGDLVLTNGSISVRTYVQEMFGFATFAGIDTSSTSDNDYALSVTATQYESPSSWNNNTNIARVVIDSNSMFDASGDKVSIMVVVLFKSSGI